MVRCISSILFVVFLWSSSSTIIHAKPLPINDHPNLYQRILTLPGAHIYEGPREKTKNIKVAIFSVFYVFSSHVDELSEQTWLAVGNRLNGSTGWIKKEKTQSWNMMLVMQFVPGAQRGPALFFKSKSDLEKIIESPIRALTRKAESLIDSVKRKKADKILIATELNHARVGGITFNSQPYFFPILSYYPKNSKLKLDNGDPITLLEVASVNANANANGKLNLAKETNDNKKISQSSTLGVAFVIDTTISMQPYIDRTKQLADDLAKLLNNVPSASKVKFAAVGFRNNMDEEPQKSNLEYVVKKFLDFDDNVDSTSLTKALDKMKAARVSTRTFNEDAIAGLKLAINDLDWKDIDYKFVFLITDAGTLNGSANSKFPQIDLLRIKEQSKQKNIVIVPIHLVTTEAVHANNVSVAKEQYSFLGVTGDENDNKYLAIPGGSETGFSLVLNNLKLVIQKILPKLVAGEELTKDDSSQNSRMENIIINEIFRTQQTMIGAVDGDRSDVFLKGWTVEKDLTNIKRNTLQVCVLLSRKQLNELAINLKKILDETRNVRIAPEVLFDNLQSLSAAFSQDPERFRENFKQIADLKILPSYLSLLPYTSKFLTMTRRRWLSMGMTQQQELIDNLNFKRGIYQDIYGSKKWVSFSDSGDNNQDLYPIPLEYLP